MKLLVVFSYQLTDRVIRDHSLIMTWGVSKLEGGTEIFRALGWGWEPKSFGHVDGGGGELIFFNH